MISLKLFRLPFSYNSHFLGNNSNILHNFINYEFACKHSQFQLIPNNVIFKYQIRKFRNILTNVNHCFSKPVSKNIDNFYRTSLSKEKSFKRHNSTISNKIYTIPNILCLSRMALSPLIGYLIINDNFQYALSICVVSSLTDFLDGWIARNFNSKSKLGAILDPLADKLLISTLTLTLTYVQMIPIWLTALIFLRDFLIILGGSYIHFRGLKTPITWKKYFDISTFSSERFHPTIISKINTVFQISLVLITMASSLFGSFFAQNTFILPVLQCTTGLTTLLSGLNYLKRL